MTTTATDPAASYAAETYALLLEDLGSEPSRTKRALILDEMAATADELADQTHGSTIRGDARGDTLAWREAGTLLRQLAAAERGTITILAAPLDDDADEDGGDFTDWDAWARVAAAATGNEYDEAVTELLDVLAAAPVPPFALQQFVTAAMACATGRPGSYPTGA